MTSYKIDTRLGVDLGGTKIEAIVMAPDGDIILRERVATPKDDYDAIVAATVTLIQKVAKQASLHERLPVGIGTPGTVSQKTGKMKNCNSTCLNGRPLREDLENSLGRAVRMANDADCFALSEASDGAGRDARSVFGVILGTGVGGGLVYDRHLLVGANAIAGEWGHTTLPLAAFQPDGPDLVPFHPRRCYCDRDNCVESWLSGPGFELSYAQLTGHSLPASEIERLALESDDQALALFDHYCNLLALALSTVINIVDPEVIVLGGGMSNTSMLYTDVVHYLPRYVFSDQVITAIRPATHGDSSGVRGAAWLWSVGESYS